MPRPLGILLLLSLAAFRIHAQNAPGVERVPASQVHGTTLTLPDGSAAIDAPAGWVWLHLTALDRAADSLRPNTSFETYVAVDAADKSHSFLFSAVRDGSPGPPSATYMEGVGSGMQRTSPKTGWHVSDYRYEKVGIPLPSSYRYECLATSDAGVVKHRFGYVAGQDAKYNISCSTEAASEPEDFRRFVASFRLLPPKSGD